MPRGAVRLLYGLFSMSGVLSLQPSGRERAGSLCLESESGCLLPRWLGHTVVSGKQKVIALSLLRDRMTEMLAVLRLTSRGRRFPISATGR